MRDRSTSVSPPISRCAVMASIRAMRRSPAQSRRWRSAGSARYARPSPSGSTRACPSAAPCSNGRSSSAQRRSSFSMRPIMPRSIWRYGPCDRMRQARPSRRSPTRCCAESRANATRFLRPPTRSTTTRLRGSRRAGARTTAKRRLERSPPRTARSRRSTSASRATRPAGRRDLGGLVLPTGSVRLDTHQARRRP